MEFMYGKAGKTSGGVVVGKEVIEKKQAHPVISRMGLMSERWGTIPQPTDSDLCSFHYSLDFVFTVSCDLGGPH